MWKRRRPCERSSMSLLISYPWRGRASRRERMSSSAEPFLSSRSSMRPRTFVIATYAMHNGAADQPKSGAEPLAGGDLHQRGQGVRLAGRRARVGACASGEADEEGRVE